MPAACLVVGLGSIGSRHARVLEALGCTVATVSRRGGPGVHRDLATGLDAAAPDYVVIATETADHGRVLDQLAARGFAGLVLVEKPLFATARALPAHRFRRLGVAFNLRFHPALARLRQALEGQRLLSAQLYCGQYLPDWRPGRDYRQVYSARAGLGGGVLRDLSHELDLANWLLGPWRRLAARGGHWSDLEIDADDHFLILAEFERCPAATIQINYVDRRTRRDIVVNTAAHSYTLDLIAATLSCDREPSEPLTLGRDEQLLALHRAMLAGDESILCDAAGGLRVVTMIDAAERAATTRVWVEAG